MLGINETGDLFGLYLENRELSSEEFLEMMKGEEKKGVSDEKVQVDKDQRHLRRHVRI